MDGTSSAKRSSLNFDHNRLFGRTAEMAAFRQILTRVRYCCHPATASPEFVLVHGNSGCGKTALVRRLQKKESTTNCSDDDNFLWVDGKYDQFDRCSRPFGAIAEATELLHKLNQPEIDDVLENIDEKMFCFLPRLL